MGFDKPSSDLGGMLASTKAGSSGMGDNGIETDIKPIGQPVGKKPKPKSPMATFLGADVEPGEASANNGGKTLLGM